MVNNIRIELALRQVVRKLYRQDPANVTVKRARADAEAELGLDSGFFKEDDEWKERSKSIVGEAFQKLDSAGSEPEPVSSPVVKRQRPGKTTNSATASAALESPKKTSQKKTPKPKAKPQKRPKKRPTPDSDIEGASEDEASNQTPRLSNPYQSPRKSLAKKGSKPATKARKRQQKSPTSQSDVVEEQHEATPLSSPAASPQKPSRKRKLAISDTASLKKAPNSSSSANKTLHPARNEDDVVSIADDDDEETPKDSHKDQSDLLPSSQLSDVHDSPPPPKRKKRTSDSDPNAQTTTKTKAKKSPATTTDLSPKEAEIKTLQSHLLRCGVRKIWAIELKKFDTSEEKIRHLKGMLREVGMEGRFSEEKARTVKERREMEKDLEEIKKGEVSWGRGAGRRGAGGKEGGSAAEGSGSGEDEEDADEEEETEPQKRRLAKGLAQLAEFDDEEESDGRVYGVVSGVHNGCEVLQHSALHIHDGRL